MGQPGNVALLRRIHPRCKSLQCLCDTSRVARICSVGLQADTADCGTSPSTMRDGRYKRQNRVLTLASLVALASQAAEKSGKLSF